MYVLCTFHAQHTNMVKKPVAAAAGSSKKKGSIGLLSFGQYSRVIHQICSQYKESATTRTKLIDSFLAFLVVLGLLQFVFCVLVGTFVCRQFNGFTVYSIRVCELLTSRLMGFSEGLLLRWASLYWSLLCGFRPMHRITVHSRILPRNEHLPISCLAV